MKFQSPAAIAAKENLSIIRGSPTKVVHVEMADLLVVALDVGGEGSARDEDLEADLSGRRILEEVDHGRDTSSSATIVAVWCERFVGIVELSVDSSELLVGRMHFLQGKH